MTEDEPKPYKMAKWAYKACMDDTELEVIQLPFHSQTLSYLLQRLGVEPMKRELEKLGGWPVLEGDSWKETNFTLDMAWEFMKNGHDNNYIFNLEVGLNLTESTKKVIGISTGRMMLPGLLFQTVGYKPKFWC